MPRWQSARGADVPTVGKRIVRPTSSRRVPAAAKKQSSPKSKAPSPPTRPAPQRKTRSSLATALAIRTKPSEEEGCAREGHITPPSSPSKSASVTRSAGVAAAAAEKLRRAQASSSHKTDDDGAPRASRKRALTESTPKATAPAPGRPRKPIRPTKSVADVQRKRIRTDPPPSVPVRRQAFSEGAYYTTLEDDETLKSIGLLHGVDPKLLLQINRGRHQNITVSAKMFEGTSIQLPEGVQPQLTRKPAAVASLAQRQAPKKAAAAPRRRPRAQSPADSEESAPREATPEPVALSEEDAMSEDEASPETLTEVEVAKKCLSRGSDPKELVCRDEEKEVITEFISTCVSSKTSGALYVSGKPGTGKTATVGHVLRSLPSNGIRPKIVQFNCMSASDPKQVYSEILATVSGSRVSRSLTTDEMVRQLENKYLVKSAGRGGRMVLLVLDEVDQLETRDKSVLYKLFEWAQGTHSNVVLVGIANSLDLTERVLPMLKGRGIDPKLMHFHPYTKEQLIEIVHSRLRDVPKLPNGKPVLSDIAIKLCAGKVTHCNGDLRNCLDICCCAVEIAAKSPEKPQLQIMSDLFKQAFGSDTVQQMRKLPVAQKLILCVLYQSHTEGAYIAVSDLNTEYLKVCAKKGLQAVDESFIKILSLMVCSGLVEMKDLRGKSMLREGKVRLRGVRDDVRFAYENDPESPTLKGFFN